MDFRLHILILFLNVGMLTAQSPYFFKYIQNPDCPDDWTRLLAQTEDGIIHQSGSFCPVSPGPNSFKTVKMDFYGNHLWTSYIPHVARDTTYYLQGVCASPSGIFMGGDISYYRDDTLRKRDGTIFKFDHNGQLQWTKDFGGYSKWAKYISNYMVYKDGYLYWLTDYYTDDSRAATDSFALVLFKLDTLANVIWRTQLNTHPDYPKTKAPYSRYFTVNDKGQAEICAVVGETVTWPVISNRKKYAYAGLVDSSGKIIREYRIDADKMLRDSLDTNRTGSVDLKYLTGSFDQSGKTIWMVCRVHAYTEIIVFGLDTIGNVDFIKTPNFSIQSIYSKIKKIEENTFLGLIECYEYPYPGSEQYEDGSGIISFDELGNVNWCRRFYLPNKRERNALYFFDALQLPNKNIVVSGDYYTYNQWGQLDSDTYLIGLDSLGCPFPGCTDADSVYMFNNRMISALEDQDKSSKALFSYSLDDYHNKLKIIFNEEVDKPEIQFILSDVSGQIIKSGKIKKDEMEFTIDIERLQPGIYILGLQSNRIRHGLKFVKSK